MTPEQIAKMKVAIGDRHLWPLLTDDPEVNYETDRALSEALRGQDKPPWHEASPEVREIYIEEAVLFKKEPEIRRPPPGLVY